MASPLRVLTYSRVSTSHHEQKPEIQVDELRRYCAARNWQIAEEIVDHGYSGGTDQRPGLKKLLTLVHSRKVDCVVVTKLDRMARSLRHLVVLLDEFSSLGIQFVSIGDQIDLGTPSGRLMLHIVASFSEFERALMRERTLMGLQHAKSRGKTLGRPTKHSPAHIIALRQQGLTYREINRRTGIPMGCISRAVRAERKSGLVASRRARA